MIEEIEKKMEKAGMSWTEYEEELFQKRTRNLKRTLKSKEDKLNELLKPVGLKIKVVALTLMLLVFAGCEKEEVDICDTCRVEVWSSREVVCSNGGMVMISSELLDPICSLDAMLDARDKYTKREARSSCGSTWFIDTKLVCQ